MRPPPNQHVLMWVDESESEGWWVGCRCGWISERSSAEALARQAWADHAHSGGSGPP